MVASLLVKFGRLGVICSITLGLTGCFTKFDQRNTDGTPPAGVLWKVAILGPSLINANTCSPYSVEVQDSTGVRLNTVSDTTVGLNQNGNGQFYTDASCSIATNSVLIPNGQSSTNFFYKNATVQNVNLEASDAASNLLPGSLGVTVDGISQLALSGPRVISTNQCRQFGVSTQNPSGVSRQVGADLMVLLSGSGAGSFYSDASCTLPTSSALIASGSSSAVFYLLDAQAENLSLTAMDAGASLTPANLSVLVDGPTQLSLTGAASLYADSCSPYTVSSLNGLGVPSPVFQSKTVNLSGAGTGAFYSDSVCTQSVSSTTLNAGSSQQMVYYKNPQAGSVVLSAQDSTGTLGAATTPVMISGANQIKLTGPTQILAGACNTYTVTSQNAAGTATPVIADLFVALSGAGSGSFYSNASCSAVTTSVAIASGTSAKNFYYRANAAQTVNLMGTAPSPFGSSQMSVSSSDANRLAIVGPNAIQTGVCESYRVESRNNANALSNVISDVTVDLANAGSGVFYGNSTCTASIATRVISAGSNSATFYFKSLAAGTNVMTATDTASNLQSATHVIDAAMQVATLSISEDPVFDFGDVPSGSDATHSFLVTNSGSLNATNVREALSIALVTPFDFAGGSYPGTNGTCGSTIAVGTVCTIAVTFAPTQSGSYSDSIAIEYFNGNTSVIASRNIMGESTTSANGGQLDPSFSGDGTLVHNLPGVGELLHGATIQQPNGKVLVAGTARPSSDWDFVLVRYLSNGGLDTTFGTNGVVYTDFRGGDDNAYALTLQSDGKIVAAGRSQDSNGQNQGFAVARYHANGTLDSSFGGGDGKVVYRVGTSFNVDEANAVAIDSNGKIVIAGRADNDMLFARMNSNGSLDTTFGTTGIRILSVINGSHAALAMKLQSDGKIVVSGYASDTSFSSSGVLVVRLTYSGNLDGSFNSSGYTLIPVGNAVDMGRGLDIDSSGRIVVVGTTSNVLGSYNMLLARLTPSGSLDGSFDADGIKITSLSDASLAEAVRVQSDGKIVVVGYQWGSQDKLIVARYKSDGFLDETFSSDGIVSIGNGRAHGMTIQSDGKIIAVGEASDRIAVVRLLP